MAACLAAWSGEAAGVSLLRGGGGAAAGHDPSSVVVALEPGTSSVSGRSPAGPLAALRVVELAVPSGQDANAFAASLRAAAGVRYATPVQVGAIAATPVDPLYPQQWNLTQVTPADTLTATGGLGVRVAIIDTGIAAVPDLACVARGPSFDAITGFPEAADDHGHGTLIASVLAACWNDRATAGVAPGVTLLAVKAADATGAATDIDVAEGIVWAADQGARLVSVSIEFGAPSPVLADAVTYATGKGVLVVAAAGNGYSSPVAYPAALPEVVAVTATDRDGYHPDYANVGPENDVAAPGGNSFPNPQYAIPGETLAEFCDAPPGPAAEAVCWGYGTSLSVPHVVGAAALHIERYPALAPGEIAAYVRWSARDAGAPGVDPTYGAGILDVARDLLTAPPQPGFTVSMSLRRFATFTAQSTGSIVPIVAASWTFGDGSASAGLSATHNYTADGTYAIGVAVTDAAGVSRSGGQGLTVVAPPDRFTDSAGSYAHEAIEELAAQGLTAGCAPTLYCPTDLVKRGDFGLLLCRFLDLDPAATNAFHDDDGAYYEGCLDALVAEGLAAGTAPGMFSPTASLDRQAAAVFLVGAYTYRHGSPWAGPLISQFVDISGSYGRSAIEALAGMGVTAGVDPTHFGPELLLTREQVAVFLYRLQQVP